MARRPSYDAHRPTTPAMLAARPRTPKAPSLVYMVTDHNGPAMLTLDLDEAKRAANVLRERGYSSFVVVTSWALGAFAVPVVVDHA